MTRGRPLCIVIFNMRYEWQDRISHEKSREKSIPGRGNKFDNVMDRKIYLMRREPDHVRICKLWKGVSILFQGSPFEGNRIISHKGLHRAEVGTIWRSQRVEWEKGWRWEKGCSAGEQSVSPHLHLQGNGGICIQVKETRKKHSSSLVGGGGVAARSCPTLAAPWTVAH